MAGATIGQTFTTSTGTFTEVPDACAQKTEVQLVAEIYSPASAAVRARIRLAGHDRPRSDVQRRRPGGPAADDRQLRQHQSSVGALIFTATTNTYTPYIDMGDDALPDSQSARGNHRDSPTRKC